MSIYFSALASPLGFASLDSSTRQTTVLLGKVEKMRWRRSSSYFGASTSTVLVKLSCLKLEKAPPPSFPQADTYLQVAAS